jgi:TetR/AcrR family transcriptional regulator, transcriptional repressor for nem operon
VQLKERIIHEALKLFSLKGFLNTSVEDILARAHTSKGGFYNHFKSKDQLFPAVLSQARRIWRSKVLYGLEQIDEPLMKVRKLLENYRDRYIKDTDNIPGGCIFVTLSVELDDQRPDFADEIGEGFTRTLGLFNKLLDQAQAAGELREDVNTEVVSQLLFTTMLGASVRYGMDKSSETLEKSIGALLGYLDTLSNP